MAILTAAQIAAILDPNVVAYPEVVEVNAALMQNEERRKYPSIDIQNITGQENVRGFPTTTTGQTFLVHLFYRYRSFGQEHEPDIKTIEDVIYDTIFNDVNFNTDFNIQVSQQWDRKSETFPVHRSHSILTVSSEDTDFIDNLYFVDFGLGNVGLISKPVDIDNDTVEDIIDDTVILRTEGIIKSKRTIILEFATTAELLTTFRGFKNARVAQSFTITQPTGIEEVDAFVTNIATSEVIVTKESMNVQLDVVNS